MFVIGWKAESSQSVREYEAEEAWTYAIDEIISRGRGG